MKGEIEREENEETKKRGRERKMSKWRRKRGRRKRTMK